MLCKFRQEVAGIEHMYVFLEILVVMGVKEHTAFKPFIVDLLQRYRRPGQILSKVLPGSLIENPNAVVYTFGVTCVGSVIAEQVPLLRLRSLVILKPECFQESMFRENCSERSFLSVKNRKTVRLKYSVIFSIPEKGR